MTRLFGLIGFPLAHSWSKDYFTEKFHRENITHATYEFFALTDLDHLPQLFNDNPHLSGFNVTIPYKTGIINYLDFIDPQAEAIGAVNTVKISCHQQSKKLTGYNTDAFGFEKSIRPFLKPHHRAAMILGNGGAARAAAWVFQNMGIEHIMVSRKPSGDLQLAYDELSEHLFEKYTIVVNATPLGMFPHLEQYPPVPYQYLNQHHLLFDMIYNPVETIFLRKGRTQGATIKNGLEMLHLQAEKSWEIWEPA